MKTKILLIINIILMCAVILMGMYIHNEKNEEKNQTHFFNDCVKNLMDSFSDVSINNADTQVLTSSSFHASGFRPILENGDIIGLNTYCMYRKLYYNTALMCLRIYNGKEETENGTHVFYECVENPIDPLFSDALLKAREQDEITYRMCQELYYNTWKSQYEAIMQIIRRKCKYEDDIENYDLFEREMEEGFDRLKPLILNEMLDNYDMAESPEKHGYGNGTSAALLMYRGTMYRTACMFFEPLLDKDEYSFPQEEIQKSIAEILGISE